MITSMAIIMMIMIIVIAITIRKKNDSSRNRFELIENQSS
jgi:hypothetical protein